MGRGEKVTLDGFAGTPAEAPQEEARPKRKRVRAQEAPQEPEPVQEPAEALPGPAPAPSEEVTVEFDDEPSVTYVPTPTVSACAEALMQAGALEVFWSTCLKFSEGDGDAVHHGMAWLSASGGGGRRVVSHPNG